MGKKKGPALAPAFAACDEDDADALRALLASAEDAGKVAAQRNKDGWTPLHQAAFAGALECVGVLLGAGADVAARCADGDTPLHYASAQGHVDVAGALLRAKGGGGTRLLALVDHDGESVLDVALNAKTRRALQALEAELAGKDDDGGGEGEGEEGEDDGDGEEGGGEGGAR